jgi:hypothetical protein
MRSPEIINAAKSLDNLVVGDLDEYVVDVISIAIGRVGLAFGVPLCHGITLSRRSRCRRKCM